MTDIFTPEKRSWVMSQIRGKNTKIEIKMKKILKETGYKFEMHPEMYGNTNYYELLRNHKKITLKS